ncbi:group II truncated hemoglobin [Microlunatus soli]|nr:group II truncated hemoglobin [Microlunatus soli]
MTRTLYEAVGGYDALLALSHAWHRRCMADPLASHPFSHPGQHPQHSERLAAYWAEALGGPTDYTDGMGDETSVVRMHVGNGRHDELNERCIALFSEAMADVELPPETRGPLADYFRWSTESMMADEQSREDIPDGLPVPKWGFDGLQQVKES